MANKIKAKLALQLREAGVSANKVYAAHRISKKSQREVLEAAANLGITYADVAGLPDDEVYRMLFPDRNNHESVFEEPDWEYVHREMAKVGVTLQLLHSEYRDVCRESGAVAMGYDRFCRRYGDYTVSKQVTSRVGHKAARVVEVDWSLSVFIDNDHYPSFAVIGNCHPIRFPICSHRPSLSAYYR